MKRSFWLQQVDGQLQPTKSLDQDIRADIAIIGGGYVGLWTALSILEKSPDTDVVVLEKDICGGGASGRNGGFVMSWWPKIKSLIDCCGEDEAIRLADVSVKNINDIGLFCEQYDIVAHFQKKGWFWTATTAQQQGAWSEVVKLCDSLGHNVFEPILSQDLQARSGSKIHLEGVFDRDTATVQPALLVRGLRQVALQKGIRIFESTPVVRFDRQQPVTLQTPGGKVLADRVVIANNAWASEIPELKRLIVPVTSTIVMTEPIPGHLEAMGWSGGEAITDSQLMVDYYRTTEDGRIAFGKGLGAIAFGADIGPRFDYCEEDSELTEAEFRRIYPHLADVKIEHSWSGPIDRTYDSLPVFGELPDTTGIFYGIGWSGNGVGPSRIGGKILSSLALGLKDEWSQCGLVGRNVRKFPIEPFRYLGGNLVRGAVMRNGQAEITGAKPSKLDLALARLAPAGLEDKSG